jgi:hypothetical protein
MSPYFCTAKYVSPLSFNKILAGTQKKIVKLNCHFWKDDVRPNETKIMFTDGERHALVEVVSKTFFQSFGDAWFTFGDEICPDFEDEHITTTHEANKLFSSLGYTKSDLETYGTVVVEFKLLEEKVISYFPFSHPVDTATELLY